MRRPTSLVVVLLVLLGWCAVPGLEAQEPAAPAAPAPSFLSAVFSPGQAQMTPAPPAAGQDPLRPFQPQLLACNGQPCKHPPPDCLTFCLGIGADGGGCGSGCCYCFASQ
jgi:hypothetical protein